MPFLAAAAAFMPGFGAAPPAAAADGGAEANGGAEAYKARCARCHAEARVVQWMARHPDAAERAAWLDGKLTRHHAPDKARRAAIIAYLESLYAKTR